MVGLAGPVTDKIQFKNNVIIISGTGTPGVSTGSGAEAGSLYIDTVGTGALYKKSSRLNGSWTKIDHNA